MKFNPDNIYNPLNRNDLEAWESVKFRPKQDEQSIKELENIVSKILSDTKFGESKLLEYIKKFDNSDIIDFRDIIVTQVEIDESINFISKDLKEAIEIAKNNITAFHKKQEEKDSHLETMPGVKCWRKSVGIERVGLYIPGGTAPLFSTVLMLGIPAKLAGCKEIILCTPVKQGQTIHPAILYSAKIVGIDIIYKIGGAHAIGFMAYGTLNFPKVSKIFGPGNRFVTMEKMLVAKEGVAIDMPAGPSEVMVVADEFAVASFVAADLLSQCEHGNDSLATLLTTHEPLIIEVIKELELQIKKLPRKEHIRFDNIIIAYLDNQKDLIDLINEYAPEHLILSVKNYHELGEKVINAGSVFLGNYSPESAGDYASGTNHTLPTNGYAKAFSGVSLDSFVRKITFQEITNEGLALIGPSIEIMAAAEMLDAHKNAVTIRLL